MSLPKEFPDIHAVVGQVAQDYQFKETLSMPDWVAQLWERVWTAIEHAVSRMISKIINWLYGLGSALHGVGLAGEMLVIVSLTLLACVLALIIWQHRRWLTNKFTGNGDVVSSAIIGQPRTSAQWRQQAMFYKDQGSFREACRALHRACLQLLDEAGLIIFAPARSNYEYSLALGRLSTLPTGESRPQLRRTFQQFSNIVDAIYFGNRVASENEFQFCLECLQAIEKELIKSIHS